MFLKEFKYIQKEKQMIRYITNDLEISFDSDKEKFFLNKYLKKDSQRSKIFAL